MFRWVLAFVWVAWSGCASSQDLITLVRNHIQDEWSAYPSDIRDALRRHGLGDETGALQALERNQSPPIPFRYDTAQERLKDGFWSLVVRGTVQVPSACQRAESYIKRQVANGEVGLASVRAASRGYQKQNYFLAVAELLDGATFFPVAADANAATNAYRACFDVHSPEALFKPVETALGSK